ncbi:MAG: DUF4037 domain-containing protein [Caldilineaceae bacterium]|nr:DUF4037 domain-containing protein [Caldilineaceae bacterium]
MKGPFLTGLQLSEQFYRQAIQPILAAHFPHLRYSAALLGPGSEVLGYDDGQSTDHDWGPRLQLFLTPADLTTYQEPIERRLRAELPLTIAGYPLNLARKGGEDGSEPAPDDHSVVMVTVRDFFTRILRFDPTGEIRAVDWLMVPDYAILTLVRGRVFHDGLGQLAPIRARLDYYPHDVWLYLMAAQWARIGQEEHFMGRCGQVGDELGSRLIAARLVRDLMKLTFLQERQYAPYIKWFGTAFVRLACAGDLLPTLLNITLAQSWQERETYLSAAYHLVAEQHNGLAITPPLSPQVQPFFTRPFQVIGGERFADAIRAAITSEEVLALPTHLGAVDQFIDSTDAFNHLYSGGLHDLFAVRGYLQ